MGSRRSSILPFGHPWRHLGFPLVCFLRLFGPRSNYKKVSDPSDSDGSDTHLIIWSPRRQAMAPASCRNRQHCPSIRRAGRRHIFLDLAGGPSGPTARQAAGLSRETLAPHMYMYAFGHTHVAYHVHALDSIPSNTHAYVLTLHIPSRMDLCGRRLCMSSQRVDLRNGY